MSFLCFLLLLLFLFLSLSSSSFCSYTSSRLIFYISIEFASELNRCFSSMLYYSIIHFSIYFYLQAFLSTLSSLSFQLYFFYSLDFRSTICFLSLSDLAPSASFLSPIHFSPAFFLLSLLFPSCSFSSFLLSSFMQCFLPILFNVRETRN